MRIFLFQRILFKHVNGRNKFETNLESLFFFTPVKLCCYHGFTGILVVKSTTLLYEFKGFGGGGDDGGGELHCIIRPSVDMGVSLLYPLPLLPTPRPPYHDCGVQGGQCHRDANYYPWRNYLELITSRRDGSSPTARCLLPRHVGACGNSRVLHGLTVRSNHRHKLL